MPDAHVRVTVVSDYICPWCYVGLARIERLQRAFDIEVAWRPFELHPDIPPEGKDVSHRPASHYDFFAQECAAAGLPFTRPLRVPNSRRALEASEWARDHDAFDAMHHALFEAYFGYGRDIGDSAVLREAADALALDGAALAGALASGAYARRIDELTDEARGWDVTGTPTFVFEDGERRFALVGAQDYLVFENVARRMGARERQEARA